MKFLWGNISSVNKWKISLNQLFKIKKCLLEWNLYYFVEKNDGLISKFIVVTTKSVGHNFKWFLKILIFCVQNKNINSFSLGIQIFYTDLHVFWQKKIVCREVWNPLIFFYDMPRMVMKYLSIQYYNMNMNFLPLWS